MFLEFPREKHTIWDNEVPITRTGDVTRVYLTDEIMEPSMYNELCYKLRTAEENEVFDLFINTPGGIIDSALMVIDAIHASKATTIANISGTVASAGTIITLACDKINIAPHTAFMIHNYSGGMRGKGHEMKAHQAFIDKNLNLAFNEFYGGFLTDKEIEEVIEGRDIWLNKSEVEERVANRSI